ncbi:hypothetical protein NHX12_019575 [Muraenolepis orangiensis]|uniref:Uncharacterized protein n=1 Tax=Muraenolepis orangiensis TaxID=630683 RepID=A0A9Q0EWX3_9TELE|nr:hypothetical protein NHX12_019575 [Muraenolepis orangiensis]
MVVQRPPEDLKNLKNNDLKNNGTLRFCIPKVACVGKVGGEGGDVIPVRVDDEEAEREQSRRLRARGPRGAVLLGMQPRRHQGERRRVRL